MSRRSRVRGFTLVELLVVIAIIGILVALLLPAVQAAREAGRRTQCVNNLKQIGLAMHNYHDVHRRFPFGSDYPVGMKSTWIKLILPQLEQQTLYDSFDHTQPLAHANNTAAVTKAISFLVCPTDVRAGEPILTGRAQSTTLLPGVGAPVNPASCMMLCYPVSIGPTHPDDCQFCPYNSNPSPDNWCCQGYNFGTGAGGGSPAGTSAGLFGRNTVSMGLASATDGTSNTVLAGETIPSHCIFNGAFCLNFPVASMEIPLNIKESDNGAESNWQRVSGYKSFHPGGANFVLADGSVRFLSQTIDYRTWCALGTRSGGESFSIP